MLKTVFMGTPDFAVPTLNAMVEAGYEIGYVVTKPDAVSGRGKKVRFSDVKERALELEIPILQPEKIKGNDEFLSTLRDYAPDYIVVVAYGKILTKEVLDTAAKMCINVHGSLLPRLRGAAPIQWSVLLGDEYAGVTTMHMNEGLDTGDILLKEKTPVERKNSEELYDELSAMGGRLLVKTIEELEKGNLTPEKQNEEEATYAAMIRKEDGLLDFGKSAEELDRMVRGYYPWPGTYTYLDGELFKIWQARPVENKTDEAPGTVIDVSDQGILIACKEGALLAEVVQAPGKKRMAAADYLRGRNVEKFSRMG